MKTIKKYNLLLFILIALTAMACSKDKDSNNEVEEWKTKNKQFFKTKYEEAKTNIANNNKNWKIVTLWSIDENEKTNIDDHIVIRIIKNSNSKEKPLFTDTVNVHYRGRLIPTEKYSDGYVCDQTYMGELNLKQATPRKEALSNLPDGLLTAIQTMHKGEEVEVVVPAKLAFGNKQGAGTLYPSMVNSIIPTFSTLIYRVCLQDFYPPTSRKK